MSLTTSSPPRPGREWRNWEGRHRSFPTHWHQPSTIEELQDIVRAANQEQTPIKVVGAGHSWSDIALPHVRLVSLDRMNQILHVDHEKHQVTVQAGIRLRDLNEKLAHLGLGLSNQGSVNAQSIAGAIATGTHGSGVRFGNIATQVRALEIVTADGQQHTASTSENPDLFHAARIGLGALGILTSVTLQCEPAFSLHSLERPVAFADLLQNIHQYAQEADHCKVWWFPHTDYGQLWQFNRVSPNLLPSRWQSLRWWWKDNVLGQRVSEILLWLSSVFPTIIPSMNRFVRAVHYKPAERIDRSDRIFNIPVFIRHPEMEYAIPIEHTAEVLTRLRSMIEEQKFRVNFIIEIRFVKGDDIWLSPAYQRDSCYIGVMMYRQEKTFPSYFRACEEIFLSYQGRPHWAKFHHLSPDQLSTLYPRYRDFSQLRQQLDPHRLFCNPHLDRLFPRI